MLKKTITFDDYDGVKRTEVLHFNLSKGDITELALLFPGGPEALKAFWETIALSKDPQLIVPEVKKLIALSYGILEESENGRFRFRRSEQLTDDFVSSMAFDELVWSLVTDVNAIQEFFLGILPKNLADEVSKLELPGISKKEHTLAELEEMSDEDFFAAVGTDKKNWSKDVLLLAFKRRDIERV
jgi:hypothetical protein